MTDVKTGLVYHNISVMQCHHPGSLGRANFWKLVANLPDNFEFNNVDEIVAAVRNTKVTYTPQDPRLGGIICNLPKGFKSPFSTILQLDSEMGILVTRDLSNSWLKKVCTFTDSKSCEVTKCDERLGPTTITNGQCKYQTLIKLTFTLPWQNEIEEKSERGKGELEKTGLISRKIYVLAIARSITCQLKENEHIVDARQHTIYYNDATKPLLNYYGKVLSPKRNFSMNTIYWHLDYVGSFETKIVTDSINRYLSALLASYNVTSDDDD